MSDKPTCCLMRVKVLVAVVGVVPEEACGISDTIMADFMRFDLEGPPRTDGKRPSPVIGFAFCPWCGKKRDEKGATRITDITHEPDEESGEEWKK